jgi:uncharacterized DUF497 family protein
MVEIEFDKGKSDINKKKHGIDFIEARALWQDEKRIEIPARTVDEARLLIVGIIEGIHWSAIVTCRGNRIRIISVRHSREEEVKLYESEEFRQEV